MFSIISIILVSYTAYSDSKFPLLYSSSTEHTQRGCVENSELIKDGFDFVRSSISSQRNLQYGPPCTCGKNWTRVIYYNEMEENNSNSWTNCNSATECKLMKPLNSNDNEKFEKICGRIQAVYNESYNQDSATYAFEKYFRQGEGTVDNAYLDGVSIAYNDGGVLNHVWSFAAPQKEGFVYKPYKNCNCSSSTMYWPFVLPDFIGDNYFCDFNVDDNDGLLWSGQGCKMDGTCCNRNQEYFPSWFCWSAPKLLNSRPIVRKYGDAVKITLVEIYIGN